MRNDHRARRAVLGGASDLWPLGPLVRQGPALRTACSVDGADLHLEYHGWVAELAFVWTGVLTRDLTWSALRDGPDDWVLHLRME